MKRQDLVWKMGRLLAVVALLGMNLWSGLGITAEAAPPPPRGGGRNLPPSANLIFEEMDKIFDPKVGVPGEPLTYTLKVRCDPYKNSSLNGRDAYIELKMIGDQQFVSYDPLNTKWTMRDITNDTIFIDIGTLNPGEEGTIKLHLTVPTNLNKTIMEQGIYLHYQDDNSYHNKGFTILLPLKVGLSNPGPTAPSAPDQPGPTSPGQTASGPFARQVAPSASVQNSVTNWFIPATGHNIGGDFLTYWLEHGAVLVFGYPISELFQEPDSNLVVQYFERGVMEYHPENQPPYQILLKSLGREMDKVTPGVDGSNAPSPGSVYYSETSHWLDRRFVKYWQDNGGLAQFGFPISEPVVVGNRLIQWTERARFEVDVNSNFVPLVQLGLVGVEFAQAKGYVPKQ